MTRVICRLCGTGSTPPARHPCRICGSPAILSVGNGYFLCSNTACGVCGPNNDPHGILWDKLNDHTDRPMIRLSDSFARLGAGLATARHKHPWVNRELEFIALRGEVRELGEALCLQDDTRIKDEAYDCAVVAMRIVEGS